jgi:hypothetical protein
VLCETQPLSMTPPPSPLIVMHVPAATASSFVYVHSANVTDSRQMDHCLRGESSVTECLACTQAASACQHIFEGAQSIATTTTTKLGQGHA